MKKSTKKCVRLWLFTDIKGEVRLADFDANYHCERKEDSEVFEVEIPIRPITKQRKKK